MEVLLVLLPLLAVGACCGIPIIVALMASAKARR